MLSPAERKARSTIANIHQYRPDDTAALTEARRSFAAGRLERVARETVSKFPPLTDDQVHVVVAVLRGSPPGASQSPLLSPPRARPGNLPGHGERASGGTMSPKHQGGDAQ